MLFVIVWCGHIWCGVVWCGVVMHGAVWYGILWCGMLSFDFVWCGGLWRGVCKRRQTIMRSPFSYLFCTAATKAEILQCCAARCTATSHQVSSHVLLFSPIEYPLSSRRESLRIPLTFPYLPFLGLRCLMDVRMP